MQKMIENIDDWESIVLVLDFTSLLDIQLDFYTNRK